MTRFLFPKSQQKGFRALATKFVLGTLHAGCFLFASCSSNNAGNQDRKPHSDTADFQVNCNATANDICGPFSRPLIAVCKKFGGGGACDSTRWNKTFHDDLVEYLQTHAGNDGLNSSQAADAQSWLPNHSGSELFGVHFVSKYAENYEGIADEIGYTHNACAAFASAALQKMGVSVQELLAQALASDLLDKNWLKLTNHTQLLPGDLVFTKNDETQFDGLADHVFVFKTYGASRNDAYAIDNQGNGYLRNLTPGGPKSEFWFALRAP